MKKTILIPLSMLTMCAIMAGCANTDSTVSVARNLDSNLNNLSYIVRKMDTVDNSYIANPDLQIASNLLSTKENNGRSLTLAVQASNTDNDINELIKQLLYNKLSERLTSNNGNCRICNQHYTCDSNGFCNNCNNKIICDSSGNCTNCGAHLNLTNGNTCTNCNNTAIINESSCNKVIRQLSGNNNELVATRLSTNEIINNIKQDKDINQDDLTATPLNTYEYNETKKLDNTLPPHTPQVINKSRKVNKYNYNPRHFDSIDSLDITEQIDNYINKIQKLYAMSSDTLEANTILNECKNTLLDTVVEVKTLNKEVINGTCVPSTQQIQALKNYIQDIKTTISRLKNCNGDITKQVKKISESDNANVTTSVDVMNSNYLALLNQIDTRITYHESAISTLEQIKYLLEDAINTGELNEEDLIEYNNKLNDIQLQIEDVIDDSTNVETQLSDNNEYTIENSEENTTDEQTEINQIDNVQTTESNSDDRVNTNETETAQNDNEQINESSEDLNYDTNNNETTNAGIKNIDTYKNGIVDSNIDTYKKPNNSESNNDVVDNNDNTINNTNDIINENDQNTNYENNSDVIDNNYVANDTNNDNNTNYNTYNDNNVNNSQNQNGIQNGIIYQNNLNTDSNVQHRYYYGDDGKVHNSTNTIDNSFNGQANNAAGNSNYGNANNGITNNNTQNNVNTYGYNSILDTINQGTVNNGINTL